MPAFLRNSIWSAPTAVIDHNSSPPGRASMARTLTVNPSGPHQASMPSRVVQSSHTSAMGALNVRSSESFGLTATIGALQLGDIELLHAEHGLRRGSVVAVLRVSQQITEARRHDLP